MYCGKIIYSNIEEKLKVSNFKQHTKSKMSIYILYYHTTIKLYV